MHTIMSAENNGNANYIKQDKEGQFWVYQYEIQSGGKEVYVLRMGPFAIVTKAKPYYDLLFVYEEPTDHLLDLDSDLGQHHIYDGWEFGQIE